MEPVRFPVRGAATLTPLKREPADFAPVDRLRNARLHTPPGDLPQIGSRAAWTRAFTRQFGATAIQGMCTVGRAAVTTAYAVPAPDPAAGYDPCHLLGDGEGTSEESGTFHGNSFILDNVPAMIRADLWDSSFYAAAYQTGAVAVAMDATGGKYAVAFNYVVGGFWRAAVLIYAIGHAPGAPIIVGSRVIYDLSADVTISSLCYSSGSGGLLFVCCNGNVLVLQPVTADLLATNTLNGWSSKAVQARVYNDGAAEWLFVAFNGATRGGRISQPLGGFFDVDAGDAASQWRAGVMKFRITPTAGPYLLQVVFGTQPPVFSTWSEGWHNYWRVSEQTSRPPYGCQITGLAVSSAGKVAITRTNQGYGPTAAYPPDGRALPGITLTLINADGSLAWEADSGSIVEPGLGGYYNDIPIPGETGITAEPSLQAVAFDSAGDLYAGGRLNGAGFSAFKFRGSDGELVAATKLTSTSTTIRRGALAVDPSDNNPVFGGGENSDWTGASGAASHLWKVDGGTMAVIDHYALTAPVSCFGLAIGPDGTRVYGTDTL